MSIFNFNRQLTPNCGYWFFLPPVAPVAPCLHGHCQSSLALATVVGVWSFCLGALICESLIWFAFPWLGTFSYVSQPSGFVLLSSVYLSSLPIFHGVLWFCLVWFSYWFLEALYIQATCLVSDIWDKCFLHGYGLAFYYEIAIFRDHSSQILAVSHGSI